MVIVKEAQRLDRSRVVVLISYWSEHKLYNYAYYLIKKFIPNKFGYIYYRFSSDLINDDVVLTKNYFNECITRICADLTPLEAEKKDLYIYGQSLGGLFAMIIIDKIKIKRAVLICPGDNLAESLWNGSETQDIKNEYMKKGITLNHLKELWSDISPDYYFKNKSRFAEFYIKLSNKDTIIPTSNGVSLLDLMKERGIKFNLLHTSLPHKLALLWECIWPKSSFEFLTKDY